VVSTGTPQHHLGDGSGQPVGSASRIRPSIGEIVVNPRLKLVESIGRTARDEQGSLYTISSTCCSSIFDLR